MQLKQEGFFSSVQKVAVMSELLQDIAGKLQSYTQSATRTLLDMQLEVEALCTSINRLQADIDNGRYDGIHDQGSLTEMITVATEMRDQVALFFDDLFVLNRALFVGIALGQFDNIEEVFADARRFSERIDEYQTSIASLRSIASRGNTSTPATTTATTTFPPLPDLSKFDFKYRPKLKPVFKKDIDEYDPFSRYHQVAYYDLPATTFGDILFVYCDVKKEKGPGRYTYFLANENYEQTDGPLGECMESWEEEFSMIELIRYLETYELTDMCPVVSLCQRLYDALAEYESLPISKLPDMEVGSTMYPQLKEFYDVLFDYLLSWVNQHKELPRVEEFLAVVDHFVDQI
jgi:hypothetical protein